MRSIASDKDNIFQIISGFILLWQINLVEQIAPNTIAKCLYHVYNALLKTFIKFRFSCTVMINY